MNRTERLILTVFMLFVIGMLAIAAWNAVLLATTDQTDGGPLKIIVEAIAVRLR